MRILFLHSFYKPYVVGGAEIALQCQVEGLRNAGHEVAVLSGGPEKGLREDRVDGVPVWRAEVRNLYFSFEKDREISIKRKMWHLLDSYNPRMRSAVRKVLADFRPDVVSCHCLPGWSIAAWDEISRHRIPIVQVLHDHYLVCAKSTMFKGEQRCKKRCLSCRILRLMHCKKSNQVTAVVGVSRFILNKFMMYGYFKNALLKTFVHQTRQRLGEGSLSGKRTEDGTIGFGFIGMLDPNKGVDRLLKAFTGMAHRNWKLIIAGTGKPAYEDHLKKRYHDPRVEFVGHVLPKDFYPKIDFLVMPSLCEEAFGMVAAEALTFGKPVLGSNRGGIPEILQEGVNGYLFNPEDHQNFQGLLEKCASEISFWRKEASQICTSALQLQDEAAWLNRWLDIYRSAIALHQTQKDR